MDFLAISGWVLAVFMALWKFSDHFIYKREIIVESQYPYVIEGQNHILITIMSKGRKQTNLIDVGIMLFDGSIAYGYSAFLRMNIQNMRFHYYHPHTFTMSENDLRDELIKRKAKIVDIYTEDETGKFQSWPAPDSLMKMPVIK